MVEALSFAFSSITLVTSPRDASLQKKLHTHDTHPFMVIIL